MVVELVAVDVVNDLSAGQRASELLCGNLSMDEHFTGTAISMGMEAAASPWCQIATRKRITVHPPLEVMAIAETTRL
jgi:hypothetical protein